MFTSVLVFGLLFGDGVFSGEKFTQHSSVLVDANACEGVENYRKQKDAAKRCTKQKDGAKQRMWDAAKHQDVMMDPCGIESNMDACGVESYTKHRCGMWDVAKHACGVESYTDGAKHRNIMMDACGVESYTKQTMDACGVERYT
jgi:hypothetical protein